MEVGCAAGMGRSYKAPSTGRWRGLGGSGLFGWVFEEDFFDAALVAAVAFEGACEFLFDVGVAAVDVVGGFAQGLDFGVGECVEAEADGAKLGAAFGGGGFGCA